MRRIAVLLALTAALGGACNRPLLLPSDLLDGGTGTGGSGGATTSSGGAPGGSGGRTGLGGMSNGGGFGGGGKPGSGGNNGMPEFCQSRQRVQREIQRAKVVFALGRNATMATPFGTAGATRLSAAQQVIRDVVKANQRAVAFGYEDFPAAPGACQNGSSCCTNTSTFPAFPSLFNYGLIDSALMSCDVSSGPSGCVFQSTSRPLADVLRNVLSPPQGAPLLDPLDTADQRLVLIVDGSPGCSSEDAGVSCSNALKQLSQLRARVRIHVIPIGVDVDAESTACLKSIALQGDSEGTTAQPFVYRAADPTQLTRSLYDIAADAANAACIIQLIQVPADSRRVSLEIQRQSVPRDQGSGNGWAFAPGSGSTIEVHGAWCDTLKNVTRDDEVTVWNCQ